MLRRTILTALAVLCTLVSTGFAQGNKFQLKGTTDRKNNGLTIYIMHQFGDKMLADSMKIKNGKFSYEGLLDGPTMVNLLLKHRDKPFNPFSDDVDKFTTYLDKGTLKLKFKDLIKDATYSGNEMAKAFQDYRSLFKAAEERYAKDKSFEVYFKERSAIQRAYIKQNPNSYFSLLALSDMVAGRVDTREIDPLFSTLSDEVKNTPHGKRYQSMLDRARPTALGATAPDFEQANVDGKMLSLRSLRGKYVLIDFWASWCKPCRAENPVLVDAYGKFKDKGFTILGVSLDDERSKKAWIQAIEQDKLTWPQVSDLKGWKNDVAQLYNISSVPQNLLLDPEGKIIAKNLKGDALVKKLSQLL